MKFSKNVNNKKCAPKIIFFDENVDYKHSDIFWRRKLTLKVRILPFLTTFAQLSARLKNFLGGWLLVLGLKEGLVECATVCVKSVVILGTVFCYQNCSDLLWEKNVLVIEKNVWNSRLKAEFAKLLRSLEQCIQTVKGQNNFW